MGLMAGLLKEHSGEWSPEALEPVVKSYVETQKIKLGDFAKPARSALTGRKDSPSLFEVIWAIGKDECIARLEDAAAGKYEIKQPAAVAAPSPPEEPPTSVTVTNTVPSNLSPAEADAQAKAVGDAIRELKTKLKADGLSGKKIDANDEVKALVAKMKALKEVASATGAPAVDKESASSAPSGASVDEQIKSLGDEIRALKQKLKADGLSGKKADADPEVKAKVAKLQELKACQAK